MDIAKVFLNGRSQAVRLPKDYRLEGSEVYVKKIDDVVLLIPKDSAWKTLKTSLKYFSDDFFVR
jgi:antitoxin VapB